jgi:hypothetical protein
MSALEESAVAVHSGLTAAPGHFRPSCFCLDSLPRPRVSVADLSGHNRTPISATNFETAGAASIAVYVRRRDEGGRHTPFFRNYRLQFYFRTADVTGKVQLGNDVEMVMPGDNAELAIALD